MNARKLTYTHVFLVTALLVAVFVLLASLRPQHAKPPPPPPIATEPAPDEPGPGTRAILVFLELLSGPRYLRNHQ